MTALDRVTTPPDTRAPSPRWNPLTLSLVMVAAAAVSLAIAVRAPISTAVLGLVLFGILHNLLEIRYVAGRFSGLFSRRFILLCGALISGIVLCRIVGTVIGRPAQYAEIVLGYLILGLATWWGLTSWRRWIVLAILAPAAFLSLTNPAYHFVVLTHLHNLVPIFFLWEWARRLAPPSGRALFRATQVAWILVIPLVILFGGFDAWLNPDPGIVAGMVGEGSGVIAANAPPGQAATMVGMRFLTMFAFMQTMHYVVWVAFLPRVAPDATAAFEAKVPWLTGPRLWAIGFGLASLLAVVFAFDYGQGKALYAALATYHAYLEFPVLLALLLGGVASSRAVRRTTAVAD